MKKYRVNESEHFNLYSMHDKLKCIEIDMQEAPAHTYTDEQWDEVQERISEVEELMEKAYCVAAPNAECISPRPFRTCCPAALNAPTAG